MARPPLLALRAFDEAAQRLSFGKAAEALHVTPSALSHQIKLLEEHFGTALFERRHRAVRLTAAGEALAPGVRAGFEALDAAAAAVARLRDDRSFTITAGPAFTAKWLAPRFFAFAQAHPEIDLRFFATLRLVDLERDGVDVAIRFGRKARDDASVMADDWVTPVCAPELAGAYARGAAPGPHPLLVDESILEVLDPAPTWRAWAGAFGLEGDWSAGARFSQADHAIDAAIAGAGLLLGRAVLIETELRAGRLVRIERRALRTGGCYRFLAAKQSPRAALALAFRRWLEAELAPVAALAVECEFRDLARR